MSTILKATALFSAILMLSPTFANYRINVPLETNLGGRLPNGSINFGQKDNENNEDNSVSKNCIYDQTNYVEVMNQDEPNRLAKAGDATFVVNANVISIYSPSNNEFPKPGLSYGKEMETYTEASYFEICGDNLESYPLIGNLDGPETPVDDHSGPDWTPECIFNINSDYSAYDRVNRQYVMHSSQFGISVISRTWTYTPADYDPEREGSYMYLNNSSKTGIMNGQNPDYDYAGICRVRKMLQ